MKGKRSFETYLKVSDWKSEYISIQRLLNYLARKTKSEGTKTRYLEWLHKFCLSLNKNPDEIVLMSPSELKHASQDFVNDAGRSNPDTGNNARAALLAFFKANGFDGDEKKEIRIEGFFSPTRKEITGEYIPTKEEIYKMSNSGRYNNNRDRAIILCLYSSGLRNATLRALRWKDIKDEFKEGKIPLKVPVYPAMKEVIPDACKGKIPYYTFFSKDAVEALRLYIGEFEERFGEMADDQVIFTGWAHNLPEEYRFRPLGRSSLVHIIKMAAKRAGIKEWKKVYPHCLRKAFETVLRIPMIDGSRMDVKTQEFLMGHILPGTEDTYYDKTKVDLIRSDYAKLSFSSTQEISKKEAALEAVRRVAEAFGIDPMKVRIEKQKELKHELDADEEIEAIQNEIKKLRVQTNESGKLYQTKIVTENDLVHHIEEGWEIVRELNNGKFLVRKANNIP
jgi:integrase